MNWKKVEENKICDDLRSKRVLFCGIGGGCDIITAFTISRRLVRLCGEYKMKEIHYANTKRRPHKTNIKLKPFIYRVCDQVRPIQPNEITYGSTKVSDSIPRNEFGCPYIFVLPKSDQKEDIAQLSTSIKSFKFDVIVAVDAGGDSLTGGEDKDQRDLECLQILIHSLLPNTKLYHFIVAPGCDGESSVEMMQKGVESKKDSFLGFFDLDQQDCEILRKMSINLKNTRTPNLIQRDFFDNDLEKSDRFENHVIIPRMERYPIPKDWMKKVIVFEHLKK